MVYLSGILVLFGGQFLSESLGDLWHYSISHKQWARLDVVNGPSPRHSFVFTEVNSTHALLFSGTNADEPIQPEGDGIPGTNAANNELWLYNLLDNSWRLMRGAGNDAVGNISSVGAFDPLNEPGARFGASGDYTHGLFWMFGGQSANQNNGGLFYRQNDLWSYDIARNQWSFVQGDESYEQANYQAYTADPVLYVLHDYESAHAGGLFYHTLMASDRTNELWIVGGLQPNGAATTNIWRYSVANKTWAYTQSFTEDNVQEPNKILFPSWYSPHPPVAYGSTLVLDSAGDFIWQIGGLSLVYGGFDARFWLFNMTAPDARIVQTPVGMEPICGWGLAKYPRFSSDKNDRVNQRGQWVHEGVRDPMAMPAGRAFAARAVDPSTNSLWFYGGYGRDSVENDGALSDLWLVPLDNRAVPCMCQFSQFQTQLEGINFPVRTLPFQFA
jgi:hypothetical protein